jgi:hypothetical protein
MAPAGIAGSHSRGQFGEEADDFTINVAERV